MILRRVIQHLRKQEWTAIGIDFLIVVLGVFVGIQVSNWNAEREINKKSAVFTERLNTDLRGEAWGYEYLILYNKDILMNAERVLSVLDGEAEMSDEQFVISAYRASQYKYNVRQRATYDEMISTGSIDLISDQTLRKTAVEIYTSTLFDEISRDGQKSEYREIFRRSISKDVQRALLKQCGDRFVEPLDYLLIVKSLDYDCTLDVSTEKISAAAKSLRSNEELVPALQFRFADIETALADLDFYNPKLNNNLRKIAGRSK
jgi:Family of unknown function (DUF6090)